MSSTVDLLLEKQAKISAVLIPDDEESLKFR